MKAVRVAIRADASAEIGSGHVMRCLTLAEALSQNGTQIIFLCQTLPNHLEQMIIRKGFVVQWLTNNNSPTAIAGGHVNLLIVDHYELGYKWQRAMRSCTDNIMVIDDLADHLHDCDLLLNQNLPATTTQYQGLLPPHCHLLLGPEYALIRDEFYQVAQNRVRPFDSGIKRIFACFGGSDPLNLSERTLHELANTPYNIDLVISADNPLRQHLADLCHQASDGRWTLYVQPDNMATLMAEADLAIGAGGSSHWERCLLGMPALVVTVAENQRETTRLLHQQGACWWLGDAAELPAEAIRNTVKELSGAPERLEQMSRIARKVVPKDGGTHRLVSVIGTLFAADAI